MFNKIFFVDSFDRYILDENIFSTEERKIIAIIILEFFDNFFILHHFNHEYILNNSEIMYNILQ